MGKIIIPNYGILSYADPNSKRTTVEGFTSDAGIKIRRAINPAWRQVLKSSLKEDLVVLNYPELEDNESYIFTSTHGFVNDSVANLATIDRNAYLLFGTTDQLKHSKITYAAWLNGFIYVDRDDEVSRKSSVDKMERVLNSGSSVLIFPEGGFNNTENLLCQRLFASPYILAQRTHKKVVPIAPFYEYGSDTIYMNVGNPMDLEQYDNKEEALIELRKTLSSLVYSNVLYLSTHINRDELPPDFHERWMAERAAEYNKQYWDIRPDKKNGITSEEKAAQLAEEELTTYLSKEEREEKAVWESMDNIEINEHNASIMGPILVRRKEQKDLDFKSYMKNHWNK